MNREKTPTNKGRNSSETGLLLRWLKLATPVSFVLCLMLGLACKELPEEKSRPVFRLKWDTVPQVKGLILPGDSLVLISEWASRSRQNRLHVTSGYVADPTIEYAGPDTFFAIRKIENLTFQYAQSYASKFLISSNCFPGTYKITSWMQDQSGRSSDSVSFAFPLTVSAYPFSLVDTPANVRARELPISQKPIYFKVRSFGSQLSSFQYQWFDSLKSSGIQPLQVREAPAPSDQLVFADSIYPPPGNSKSFYLKLGSKTSSGRSTSYWLKFARP